MKRNFIPKKFPSPPKLPQPDFAYIYHDLHRPFQKLDGSRYSLFESIDQPALKALPNERYQFALVAVILASKVLPEQGYRACFGVMRLGKLYPVERLEAASLRALNCNAISYQSLKSILEKGLNRQALDVLAIFPQFLLLRQNLPLS